MVWIKRNLFLVLSAAIGLILLGGAGYFVYTSWDADRAAVEDLTQAKSELDTLLKKKPARTPELVREVKDSQKEVRAVLEKFKDVYAPAPQLPKVDEKNFKLTLDGTIAQLQSSASNAGVRLFMPDYAFSFSGLMTKLNFPSNGIPGWLVQLHEIKEICNIIYNAKANTLEAIHRVPVTIDESGSSDFLACSSVTNDMIIRTPYEVVIQGYSREIADVMNGFLRSSNCFIVKNIDIGPSGNSGAAISALTTVTSRRDRAYARRTAGPNPNPAAVNPSAPVTLVSENLLRAVILVDIVKPIAPLH
jgi:hypothetical protein